MKTDYMNSILPITIINASFKNYFKLHFTLQIAEMSLWKKPSMSFHGSNPGLSVSHTIYYRINTNDVST